eukprot:1842796-Lingulodinium_polyedra.AAC.1
MHQRFVPPQHCNLFLGRRFRRVDGWTPISPTTQCPTRTIAEPPGGGEDKAHAAGPQQGATRGV